MSEVVTANVEGRATDANGDRGADDKPSARPQEAIDFLRHLAPDGPWVLSAISQNGSIDTRTFMPNEESAAANWVKSRNAQQDNIYYTVNRVRGRPEKKPTKGDIEAALVLHTEIDPKEGADLDAEQARILRLIDTFDPSPTAVISSGRGYQAIWLLEEPIMGPDGIADGGTVEKYNRALSDALGGDNCHNIDRLLRLPGTVNHLSPKKRQKGWTTIARADVAESDWDRKYSLADFDLDFGPNGTGGGHEKRKFEFSRDDLPCFETVDDIEPLRDKRWRGTRDLIVSGSSRPYPSRSEALMRVVTDMMKAGCPDIAIASVLLDRRFGVSASVLEKCKPERYAARQIERGREMVGEFSRYQNGAIIRNYENARRAILSLGIVTEYDVFRDRLHIGGHAIQDWQGELGDNACAMLRQLIIEEFGFDPGKANVADAALQLCLKNHRDPVVEYLDNLIWDGTPRLDRWVADYLGAEPTPLNRAIGRIALVAAVRRAREPGCKFDNTMILEGPQGSGKSTAVTTMSGLEYFSDESLLSRPSKERIEALAGVWLYEISELEGMSKAEVNRLKAFMSRRVDRARPAYGRFLAERPRRCVFVGTTNDVQYLRDQTGNRRFWPIRTGKIDLKGLERDRDQLWAEAAKLEAEGVSLQLPEKLWADATEAQKERLEDDPWMDKLQDVEGKVDREAKIERVFSERLLSGVLEIPVDRQDVRLTRRLGQVMRNLDWDGPKNVRIDDRQAKGYERPVSEKPTDD